MNEEQTKAYEAGRAAAARGETRRADPYIQGTPIDTIPDRLMNLSIHWNRGRRDVLDEKTAGEGGE